MQINWDDGVHAANDGIAAGKTAPVLCAVAHCNNPFGIGSRAVGSFQRFAHIFCDWSGDQQNIGVPWRRDEAKSEALQVVERVLRGMDFEFATVAGAGINLADR